MGSKTTESSRNRDRRVTQTTQASREAQFKAITQGHYARSPHKFVIQGQQSELLIREWAAKQPRQAETERDIRVTQTQASREGQFKTITQGHYARSPHKFIIQGHDKRSPQRIIKVSTQES